MALHTTRRLARQGWQHTKRAIGTVSAAADKATPFYTKYVHPVLDANPETRTLAKYVHSGLMVNRAARTTADAYERIRGSLGR